MVCKLRHMYLTMFDDLIISLQGLEEVDFEEDNTLVVPRTSVLLVSSLSTPNSKCEMLKS